MDLRIVSPIAGRKVEHWAYNFLMASKTIVVKRAKKAVRPMLFDVVYKNNSNCKLGMPRIDENGNLCVDFKSEKHKVAFLLKYSDRSVWMPSSMN